MTVDEVNALIPELDRIFQRLGALEHEIVARANELERMGHNPASPNREATVPAAIAERRRLLEACVSAFEAEIDRVGALGGVLQDLERGIVDFQHVLEGQPVYLCWQVGETSVTHYHALDAGIGARRPLPGAAAGPH